MHGIGDIFGISLIVLKRVIETHSVTVGKKRKNMEIDFR